VSSGLLSASLYQRLTGTAPALSTAALTSSAGSTWTDTTETGLTDGISASTQLKYRRSYKNDVAGTGNLVLTGFFPGFASDDSLYDTTFMHRVTGYVEATTGRGLLAVALTGPGRGINGSVDYRRDRWAYRYMLNHAATAEGAKVWAAGRSRILVGMSTGALDALLYAATFPEDIAALVLIAPNWNMGYGANSYYDLQSASNRSLIEGQLAARLTSSAASLDTYRVVYPATAVRRLLDLPGWTAPIFVLGDRTEAPLVPIPDPDPLVSILGTNLQNESLLRPKITASGDDNRGLHAGLPNNDGSIYFERAWFPVVADVAEYTMPDAVEAPGLQVLGSMAFKAKTGSSNGWDNRLALEAWIGRNADAKSDATYGGKEHVADLTFDNRSGIYRFDTSITSTTTNGKIQIIGGPEALDDFSHAFTAGGVCRIELAESPTITDALTETHYSKEWSAESLSTGAVSSWADAGATLSFVQATGSKQPVCATDGNGHKYVEFDGVDDVLLLTNNLWDPRGDFSVEGVFNKLDSASRVIVDLARVGTLEESRIAWNVLYNGQYLDSANAESGGEVGGTGGANAIFSVLYQRHGTQHMGSVNGSAYQKGTIGNEWAGLGTTIVSLGAGYAGSGGVAYLNAKVRVYWLRIKQGKATSTREWRSIQRADQTATS
jgi:pimeloyl-ACP methyl ester carboxylesterase